MPPSGFAPPTIPYAHVVMNAAQTTVRNLALLLILVLSTHARAASWQPTTELVCVVQSASQLRTSPGALHAFEMLRSMGIFAETEETWHQFAEALDYTPLEAFDRVLGRRATIIIKQREGDKVPMWAVLSEVDFETEKRLKRGLKPAARGIVGNQTILAVEHGRYELAVTPCKALSCSTVLLAPSWSEELFDDLLPGLGVFAKEGSPVVPKALGRMKEFGQRDLQLVLSIEPDDRFENDAPRFLAVDLGLEGDAWVGDLKATPSWLWKELPTREFSRTTAAEWLDDQADAALAIVGVGGVNGHHTSRLWEFPIFADLARRLPTAESPRFALALEPVGESLSITGALELNLHKDAVALIDDRIARTVDTWRSPSLFDVDTPRFQGAMPAATRTYRSQGLNPFSKGDVYTPATFHWRTDPQPESDEAIFGFAYVPGDDTDSRENMQRMDLCMTATRGSEPHKRDLLFAGQIWPARLTSLNSEASRDEPWPWINRLAWSLRASRDDRLEGDVQVWFRNPRKSR